MEIKPLGGKIWRMGPEEDDPGRGEELRGALEAMLFVSGEPLTAGRMAQVLECDEETVISVLRELRDEYVRYNRGLQLREVGGGWRMHTHPAYAPYVEKLLLSTRRSRLTRAAVETLAIIAYLQPITRGQIANIRGVQSENMVRVLEELGLVAEKGKEKSPGGPALYVTTDAFLERFGLNSLEDLPPLEDFEPDEETVERIARSLAPGEGEGTGNGGRNGDDARCEAALGGDVHESPGEVTRGCAAPSAVVHDGAADDTSLREDGVLGEEEGGED